MNVPNSAAEMAKNIVGDGKTPNMWFVTVGYGLYMPFNNEECISLKNALDGITIGPFLKKSEAVTVYNAFEIFNIHKSELKKDKISQVFIEDRLSGVVCEKRLEENANGYLIKKEY